MIPVSKPFLQGKEQEYVNDCLNTTWISSIGKYIDKFETGFSQFCNAKYGVSACNGTAAVHLALEGAGVEHGDEVLVPNVTFIATANAVRYAEAKPVFVDIDPETWTIDPNKLEERVTKRTKAIIPVHLYGHPCDMDPIKDLASKYDLSIIEDAAQAHGASYKGKKVGSIGDVASFSFFGNKIITTGEGGICVTNNEELAKQMRFLKGQGMNSKKRYWHDQVGYNYRMTNIQAAIGVAQLEQISSILQKRQEIKDIYGNLLKDQEGLTLPPNKDWADPVCWAYTILLSDKFPSRDKVIYRLKENGVDSRPVFYPINDLPPYKTNEEFPVSKQVSSRGITLPTYTEITLEEIIKVTDELKKLSN